VRQCDGLTVELLLPWLKAFVFTQLIEVPIYRRAMNVSYAQAFLASAITHPVVWFVMPRLLGDTGTNYIIMVVVAELFAWSVEGAYFQHVLRSPRGYLWSLVANGASLGLGLLVRYTIGGI
jgi:hypothetical protein